MPNLVFSATTGYLQQFVVTTLSMAVKVKLPDDLADAYRLRAADNLRELEAEVIFVLRHALKQNFMDSSVVAERAQTPQPSRPARESTLAERFDQSDRPIAAWMIDANNASGYVGVHKNGRRWRTSVPDEATNEMILVEGFATPAGAARYRQDYFESRNIRPRRGRKPLTTSSRSQRIADARAAGLSPELAEKAVDDLDDLLSGRFYDSDMPAAEDDPGIDPGAISVYGSDQDETEH